MTDSEQVLTRQLKELVLERYGNLERFCNLYHYRYQSIARFLNGKSQFNSDLYDSIHEQATEARIDVNSEVVLLDIVIRKYFKTYQAFCKEAHINGDTLDKVMQSSADSTEFRRICFIAYSKALHEIEGVSEYVNKTAPGKFMNQSARRSRSLQQIEKENKRRLR